MRTRGEDYVCCVVVAVAVAVVVVVVVVVVIIVVIVAAAVAVAVVAVELPVLKNNYCGCPFTGADCFSQSNCAPRRSHPAF
eukprot:4305704-Pyramimonas_sp.AAC.1